MTSLRLSYQTIEFGKTDIHLCTLRNTQEYSDPEGEAERLGICSASWPLFGVVWPSSLVLAHTINHCETQGKKVLEVGCGIGLSSLLLNKQKVDITATDYHPEVSHFLQRNTSLNGDRAIPFERINWSSANDQLGVFDLIIGSDLLYEDNHIDLLANFIERHSSPVCEVIIVDPGRGRKNKMIKKMASFGFACTINKAQDTDYLEKTFKGHILSFSR
jgi:predicted nicotinamide N-methyase